jgi:hypothetical protein
MVVLGIFFSALRDLFGDVFNNELYSHIILIPFISGYFLYEKRKDLFSNPDYSFVLGIAALLAGTVLSLIGGFPITRFNQNDYLSLMAFAALVFWLGGIILFYGLKTFRAAIFPFARIWRVC